MMLRCYLALLLATAMGVSADCGWYLEGNDCICMNSADGSLWRDWTDTCCKAMGVTIGGVGGVCTVTTENRQTFKDCCKYFAVENDVESLIGHCR